jgi:hypothetical protein
MGHLLMGFAQLLVLELLGASCRLTETAGLAADIASDMAPAFPKSENENSRLTSSYRTFELLRDSKGSFPTEIN